MTVASCYYDTELVQVEGPLEGAFQVADVGCYLRGGETRQSGDELQGTRHSDRKESVLIARARAARAVLFTYTILLVPSLP